VGTGVNCRVVFSVSGNIAKRKTGKITEISCRWTSLWRSFNLAVAGMTANADMKLKEM